MSYFAKPLTSNIQEGIRSRSFISKSLNSSSGP